MADPRDFVPLTELFKRLPGLPAVVGGCQTEDEAPSVKVPVALPLPDIVKAKAGVKDDKRRSEKIVADKPFFAYLYIGKLISL